jgi:hypothetical protein
VCVPIRSSTEEVQHEATSVFISTHPKLQAIASEASASSIQPLLATKIGNLTKKSCSRLPSDHVSPLPQKLPPTRTIPPTAKPVRVAIRSSIGEVQHKAASVFLSTHPKSQAIASEASLLQTNLYLQLKLVTLPKRVTAAYQAITPPHFTPLGIPKSKAAQRALYARRES